MQTDCRKESGSDTDSDPDWNEQLISAVRQKGGRSKKISEKDRLERIQDCLTEGADINAVDKAGNTVLHTAIKKDWKMITEFLLHNRARTDIYNHHGHTAIALPATVDKPKIVKIPVHCSIYTNESIDNKKPSTSRESELQFRTNLSGSKSGSDQRLQSLKRSHATDDDFNESAKKRRIALDSASQLNSIAAASDRTGLQSGEKLRPDGSKEEVTQVPYFDGKKTYAASGLKRSLHGTVYQLKHLMLILHRAWKLGYPFRLSTEMVAAEKFDDLVLQYRDNTGKEVHRFVQVKHKQDESKEIRTADLLAQGDGDFSVQKYFISWRKIRNHSDFTGSDSKRFILCTNIGLDEEGLRKAGIVCKLETESDEFLRVTNRVEQPPRYKLIANEHSELHNILKAASDVCKLARVLAQRVHADKDIDLKTGIFKYYHTALAQEIIDIENRNFFRNFIANNTLSQRAQNFRGIFFSNAKELWKRGTTDQDIWKSVEGCSLKLSATFGKEFQLAVNPELTDVEKFAQEFVRLLNNASKDNVVKIARNIYHKQARKGSVQKIVADNIDKLVGHVLIREGGKIKFRSQFFDDSIQSSGNIEKFKDVLKTQLGIKFEELDRTEFEINNFKTCDEEQLYSKTELPDDDISDGEISDFFEEFVLAVNQPNETELGEMITCEIGADSQFNILNGDFIGDSFQKVMLDWFKQKGKDGVFLSNEDAEDFFNSMELKVSSLVTVGLNLAYPEALEKYGVEYHDKHSKLEGFVTSSDASETRILNLIAPKETLLTALRVYQTLLQLQEYKKDDSFIFIRLKTLLLTGIMNRVIRAFESPHSHHLLVVDCGETTAGNGNTEEVWNPLCKIVKKCSDKKMVIITQGNNSMATQLEIGIKTYHERDEDVSFNNLTKCSQRKLLEKLVINFQGQKERTSLGRLLGTHISDSIGIENSENFEEIIDSGLLVKLIRDQVIRIGNNLKGLGEIEDYYIDRTTVRRVIIKEDILKTQHTEDLFAVSDVHEIKNLADSVLNKEISETNPTGGRQWNRFTILDKDREVDQFKILCEQNPNCNIHWLHGESDKLIWKQSLGDISNLVKYRDAINDDNNYRSNSHGITKDQLSVLDKHPKIVIISDTAGMGKTTLLIYLAGKMKENKSDLLVVSIDLTHHTTVLAEEQKNPSFQRDNTDEAVDFLIGKILNIKTGSEANVFKRMIKMHGNVALFFDGFDEISPNYEDTVIGLLQTFAKLPIEKLFITTRPHTREALETKLGAFSYTMQPFSADNQIEFLTKFWKKRLDLKRYNMIDERLKQYAEAVMKILAKSVDDWMNQLTGVPLQTRMVAEVFGDIGDANRADFYGCEDFLNSEDDKPKLPKGINLIDLYHRFVDKKYYIYRTEKKKDDPTNLGVEEDSEDLREIFLKRHQTLALCTLFDKEDLRELLPSQQETNFDALVRKLNKGRERTGIVTQVINNRPNFIHRTFAEYFTATFLLNVMKNNGRCEPVRRFIVVEILLKPVHKTIRAFLNCLLSTEGDILGNESWKIVLDSYRSDGKETVLHVAAAEGNCGIIAFLLNCFREHPEDRRALIKIKDDTGQTAGYTAAVYSHWEAFKLLAQHGDVDINFSKTVGKSPLQMAVSTGNLDVVKYLVEKGADVNSRDNTGFTPIDECAHSGHLDIMKYLVSKGANINCQSNSGFTPVHWASGRSNLEVLKYLVEKGADVNSQDTFRMTPLYQSCLPRGNLDVVKYLLEAGAVVDLPSMFGVTPLQYAATSGNWDVVRYLLANGANSDRLDEHSWAMLHKARV